jgi:hypothetical protein
MSSPCKRNAAARAKYDTIDTIPKQSAASESAGSTNSDAEFPEKLQHQSGTSNTADLVGYGGLRSIEESKNYFIRKFEILDIAETNTLYQCLNAQLVTSDGNEWLMLPEKIAADGTTSHTFWVDDSTIFYKSDKFFVRKSYKDIAEIIMKESVQHPKEEGIDIFVSGSLGTGRSFLPDFFLWKLLPPSPGVSNPEMII